jgi:hypothetical protein
MQELLNHVRSLVPAGNFDVLALPGVLPQCILTMLNFGLSSRST